MRIGRGDLRSLHRPKAHRFGLALELCRTGERQAIDVEALGDPSVGRDHLAPAPRFDGAIDDRDAERGARVDRSADLAHVRQRRLGLVIRRERPGGKAVHDRRRQDASGAQAGRARGEGGPAHAAAGEEL